MTEIHLYHLENILSSYLHRQHKAVHEYLFQTVSLALKSLALIV